VFFRVLQHGGVSQTALVLLNKGNAATRIEVKRYVQPGTWRDALEGGSVEVSGTLQADVPAHGIRVFVLDAPVQQDALRAELDRAMSDQHARTRKLATP
ncbi:MAG: cyclomaltodextrin glucanotransferase, partial [Stenotrophomonas sp.]|nr:cyclomaltodextrin glucanotransferase [Stenotrophomonas sp.]